MATLIPNTARHEIARSIYRDIITDRDYYYVFGGKTLPWGTPDLPNVPQDTQNYLTEIHKNILFVNRVTPGPADIVYMVRRINWVSGTVYDEYRDDVDMSNKNFYVLLNNRIYKCLSNATTATPKNFDAANATVVNLVDDTIYMNLHGMVTGDRVVYSTKGGTAIGGLTDGTIYYVIRLNDQFFRLATTEENAASGTYISFTSLGDGTNQHQIILRKGSASTTAPQGTDILPFAVKTNPSDPDSPEYIWKFMYEIPELDRIKFLTDEYIPVRNVSDGVNFDVNGVVNYVDIVETGINYTAPQIIFEGDGSGAAATLTTDEIGSISSVTMTNSGIGYTHCRVRVVDIHAEPKDAAEIGFYGSINVSVGNTLVTGSNTQFVTQVDTGWTLVDLDNRYIGVVREVLSDTQLLLEQPSLIDITAAEVSAVSFLADSDTVVLPAHGLTNGTPINFTSITSTTGVITNFTYYVINATENTFQVADTIGGSALLLVNDGTGTVNYSNTSLNYAFFTGSGFIGNVILERETAYYTNQEVVETTMPGSIYHIEVLDPGLGYTNPTITTTGDGTGLVVSAVTNALGEITKVLVEPELSGINYHYVDFNITGFATLPAKFKAHIGPQGGHGSNIARELFANTLCINTVVKTDNPDLFVDNDVRQIGVIKNIKQYNENTIAFTENTGSGCYVLEVPSDEYDDYLMDDLIEVYYENNSGTRGLFKVVTKFIKIINGVNRYYMYISYINGLKNIVVGNAPIINILRISGEEEYTCLSVVEPEFDKQTGQIIYVNNISPLQRSKEQVETIKLFLHF
jgi:hypothetical protein